MSVVFISKHLIFFVFLYIIKLNFYTISFSLEKHNWIVVLVINIQKINFQPFFTAKPTGHATRLGLSLSYDIIKAHDGKLKV